MTGSLFAFLVLSFLVRWVVDRARARLPRIDGDLVTALAVAVGTAAAVLLDLGVATELFPGLAGVPSWADYLFTGVCLAGLSSQFNDFIVARGGSLPLIAERDES